MQQWRDVKKCLRHFNSPAAVTAVSVLPAGTNTLWNVLPVCPLSAFLSSTGTAFLLLMKTSDIFFWTIPIFFTAFSTLLPVWSAVCFTSSINPKILLLDLLWFFTPLAGIWNGIPISTALSLYTERYMVAVFMYRWIFFYSYSSILKGIFCTKKGLSNDSPWSLYYHKLNEKSE